MLQPLTATSHEASSVSSIKIPEKDRDVEIGHVGSTNGEISDATGISRPNTTEHKETAASPAEQNLEVWWDEPVDQDPLNPMNWPDSQKWGTIAVLSSITFLTSVSPQGNYRCILMTRR